MPDTTSYPNMILTTVYKTDGTIRRYDLTPVNGYVIHCHEDCFLGDEEMGIPAKCRYWRAIHLSYSTDIATINDHYEAVLESNVNADGIYGGSVDQIM